MFTMPAATSSRRTSTRASLKQQADFMAMRCCVSLKARRVLARKVFSLRQAFRMTNLSLINCRRNRKTENRRLAWKHFEPGDACQERDNVFIVNVNHSVV